MNTQKTKFYLLILFYVSIVIACVYGFLYLVDLNDKHQREKYPERYSGTVF